MAFKSDRSRRWFFANRWRDWKEKIGPREKEAIAKAAIVGAIGAGLVGGGIYFASRRGARSPAVQQAAQAATVAGATLAGAETVSLHERIKRALKSPVHHVKQAGQHAQNRVIEATALGSAAARNAAGAVTSGIRTMSFGGHTPESLGAKALDWSTAQAEDRLRRNIEDRSTSLSQKSAKLLGHMQAAGVKEIMRTGEKVRGKIIGSKQVGEVTAQERQHIQSIHEVELQQARDMAKLRKLRTVTERPLQDAVKNVYRQMIRDGRFTEAQRGNIDEKMLHEEFAKRGLQVNEDRLRRSERYWGVLTTSGTRAFDILRS